MAYDESLAQRVRRALTGRKDVVEKAMFGGLTFMVAGNMCCGVIRDELMIRLSPEATVADLRSPDVRPCEFTKRPMRGMYTVNPAGCGTQEGADRWVRLAVRHTLLLPAKTERGASRRPKHVGDAET